MPTRHITRSPVKVTGTVPDGQKFESSIEEDFFLFLRFNRLVASFEDQPVTLEWRDAKGKIRDYTPDVLVKYRTDLPEAADMIPVLCEVKPDLVEGSKSARRYKPPRKEDEEENKLKWAAAERYASNHGWGFKVYRENEIRTPYLDNARFLLRHMERGRPDPDLERRLLAALKSSGTLSLGDWAGTASSTIMERAQVLPACYWLIGTSQVDADLSTLLRLDSIIKALPDV
jgi:hypothetical protein